MENTKDYINPWTYDYSGDDGTGMINPPAFPGGGVDEQEMNNAIQTAVDKLVNGAPAALDTLGEIAEALENDESIEARLVAEIAKKLDTDTYEADKATFATKDEIPTVPTKVSELDNDANFITEDVLSDYAKSADVYTKDEADAKFLTEHQDISNLATKEEVSEVEGKIPTKVSELENDANYLTEHQSLEEYAKIEDVYTKDQADAKFLTEHQSLEDYATKEELELKANSADLANVATSGSYNDLTDKPENVSEFANDAGYLTEHQSLEAYATKAEVELKANSSDLAAVATSGSYNDLTDKPEIPVIPENVSAFTNDAGYLTEHQDLSAYVNGAAYNSEAKEIDFKHDDNVLFVIDATPFIKDGMISSVAIDNGNLVITFNTDAGKEPITIPLTDIFNPANYYTKSESDELFATKSERENGDNAVKNEIFTKIWSKPNDVEHGWFQTKYTNADGSVAQLWNESDGGGALYENKTAGIKSFVGVNADGANGVCVQIYSKQTSNNTGSRLNVNPNGIFYGVGNSASMRPEEELAVKGDVTAAVEGLAKESDIPTKVSELENDANYLTEHQSLEDYAKKEDLATVATTGSYNDLEDKPEIPEVPENVSAFTNDAGYLTEHQSLEGYATETWVNEQGFLKEHQDLSAYITGGDYNSQTKTIELKNGDTVLASIDATDFIKDGMVSEVKIEGGNLVITFNSDSGKENIAIPLTDIFNTENYYTKTETNNKFVVGKITNQNGSYALIFNESDGGGSQYFNSTANVISYVGTNDGDANGICVQIYSKNKATNEGTRINVNPNGAYYGVGASTPLDPYNEIAVKGNISDLNTQIGNELAEKDATIAALNNELYNLKKIVGDMGGAVTYDLPGEGKSFNTLMNNNGTVKLSEDVETGRFGPGMMAKNDVTLNLNGHTLEVDTTNDDASILARGSQTITIKGSGANSKIVNNGNGKILWVASTNATANIQSGNFIGNGDAPELIYCENGTINITGGTFRNSTEDKRYLLNCKDANFQAGTAKIIVSSTSTTSGPKFYDFDPSNNPEGEGTSYVAEGCHVISSVVTEDGVEYTVYTVVKDA